MKKRANIVKVRTNEVTIESVDLIKDTKTFNSSGSPTHNQTGSLRRTNKQERLKSLPRSQQMKSLKTRKFEFIDWSLIYRLIDYPTQNW